jgi:dynein light intermediate chain 2
MLLPLTIVCWKYDLFAKNLDVEVRKWLSRGLRYIAHSNNATLAFGSQNDSSLARQAISSNQPTSQLGRPHEIGLRKQGHGHHRVNRIADDDQQQMSPIDAIVKIIKEQVVVNPNPQKKTQGKLLSQEEWDLYKKEKIDRVKREKDNLMNADK